MPRRPVLFLLVLAALVPGTTRAQTPPYLLQWGSSGSGDGQFAGTRGLAVDAGGNVYVTDYSFNSRIQVFDANGVFLRKWGSNGSNPGQFTQPEDVAVDAAGNIYVTDSGRQRVQKFTSTGIFITLWGSVAGCSSADGQFCGPAGIAVDPAGNVYVADSYNCRVQKFSSDGTFLLKWGSCGTGDGQFGAAGGAWSIEVDDAGDVYVGDLKCHCIQKFTSTGGFISKWVAGVGGTSLGNPRAIARDAAGNVHAMSDGGYVHVFTPSGVPVVRWGSPGSGDGEFNSPLGIAVGPGGFIYVSDTVNYRIQKFGPLPTPVLNSSWGRVKTIYR